jgi:hypothetical protein
MRSARRSGLGRVAPAAGEIDLLRAAILEPALAADAWSRWRVDHDLDGSHGRAHAVFPAVAANLAGAGLGDDAGRLAGLRRRTWATNQLAFKAAGRALDALQPLGIEPIVAKGAALVHTAYPHVGNRSMGDIDVIVGDDLFEDAMELLVAAGWALASNSRQESYAHACSVLDGDGNEVDLHRWMVFPRFCRTPEQWSDRAVPMTIEGRRCRRYSSADELVLSVVHGMGPEHSSSIRWPIDVATLVSYAAGDSLDESVCESFWDDVVGSVNELGIARPVVAGLQFCIDHFDVAVPAEVVARLDESRTDRIIELEWRMLARGIPRPERIRPFIDTERANGRRPSARRYAAGRMSAASDGGGSVTMIRRRVDKAGRVIAARRQRRSW